MRKIIGETVLVHGFMEKSEDRLGICYSRNKGKVNQCIYIDNILGNYLRVIFHTNAYMQPDLAGYDVLCKKGEDKNTDFTNFLDMKVRLWKWEDKSQFISILNIFKEIITKYGLDILEEISVDFTDIHPTEESHKKLYEQHVELNQFYRKELKIETEKDSVKVLEAIHRKLKEIEKESFKDTEDTLIGLAAVYGEEIVLKSGGEWQLRKDIGNSCFISNIYGNKYEMAEPMEIICTYLTYGCTDMAGLLRYLKEK